MNGDTLKKLMATGAAVFAATAMTVAAPAAAHAATTTASNPGCIQILSIVYKDGFKQSVTFKNNCNYYNKVEIRISWALDPCVTFSPYQTMTRTWAYPTRYESLGTC